MAAGRLDVDNALDGLTSTQLAEWQAFEKVNGIIGQQRNDLLFGMLMSVVANAAYGSKGQFKPSDFVPKWESVDPEMDEEMKAEAMYANWLAIVASMEEQPRPGELILKPRE